MGQTLASRITRTMTPRTMEVATRGVGITAGRTREAMAGRMVDRTEAAGRTEAATEVGAATEAEAAIDHARPCRRSNADLMS